jgi:Nitroreductase family
MKLVGVGSGPIGGAVAKMDDGTRQAIDQLVRARRSIRRFTDRPVSKKLLLEIVDIAGRAPSNSLAGLYGGRCGQG